MEKLEQNSFLLELAERNKEIIYKDNKTLAKLDWLIPWAKNPRDAGKKDLGKLEAQIEELGIYKPLIVYLEKNNATILGGNQRYKILKSLREKYAKQGSDKYEYVWVSVVNADNDIDKVKYSLSDNFSAGTYSRDKLKEILNAEQGNLFSNYELDFGGKQEIDEFIASIEKTENELKMENVSKQLKDIGIDDEIIEDIRAMSNLEETEFKQEKILGTGAIQFKDRKIFVLKLVFGDENEELYSELLKTYNDGSNILKEKDGDLYQRLISVYGKGSGDVLVKTLHLLENLASLPAVETFKEKRAEEKIADKKAVEDYEELFANGKETLI